MIWSFYDKATGLFLGRTISCPESMLKDNMPVGTAAIEGRHDYLSRRVDLSTGEVVDWQPPAPDADHVWDEASKSWVLPESVRAAQHARALALAQIRVLEAQQARALREDRLGYGGAADRLKEIDRKIAVLRESVSASPPERSEESAQTSAPAIPFGTIVS